MSALATTTARTGPVSEPVYCSCGETLRRPMSVATTCFECERLDERMVCVVCEEYVGMAYCDGRPTFCSDSCEEAYWSCPIWRVPSPEPAR